ncbi:hypothetical protein B0H13DRAFT_1884120 [Mycena leptocephala]|nr:hypothetical protein B0H13DRAFT_1884120 [Mycena leptocephala]
MPTKRNSPLCALCALLRRKGQDHAATYVAWDTVITLYRAGLILGAELLAWPKWMVRHTKDMARQQQDYQTGTTTATVQDKFLLLSILFEIFYSQKSLQPSTDVETPSQTSGTPDGPRPSWATMGRQNDSVFLPVVCTPFCHLFFFLDPAVPGPVQSALMGPMLSTTAILGSVHAAPAIQQTMCSTTAPLKRRCAEQEEEEEETMDLDKEQCHSENELNRAALVCRTRVGQIDTNILQLQLERQSLTKQLDGCKYLVLTLLNKIMAEIFIHALDCPSPIGCLLPTVLAQCSGLHSLSLLLKYGLDYHRVTHIGSEFLLFICGISPQFFCLEHLDVSVTLRGDSFELLQHLMPQLKHFALLVDHVYANKSPVIMLLETVPLLHSLELCNFHPYNDLSFPWEQITTLICDHIEYCNLCKILEQTPALLHCAVSRM